jgi:hypothetical protein
MRAHSETEEANSYEIHDDPSILYALLLQEDLDWQNQRSVWDMILGLGTMALISVCGWAVIIDIARLLTR